MCREEAKREFESSTWPSPASRSCKGSSLGFTKAEYRTESLGSAETTDDFLSR